MAEKRKIIKIDEEKCNGCGLCVPSCAEGAIQIIDGKARLVSETFCDGLGACLGECPEGALTIEEREADGFDEKEVEKHLEQMKKHAAAVEPPRVHGGCPGSLARSLEPKAPPKAAESGAPTPSQLRNWPVQLHLAPVKAPYFKDAKLLIAADCVPFAYADFHKDFLADRVVIIGCPKLDDSSAYLEKLINIFAQNDLKSVEVLHMEVPCCFGLERLVGAALSESGKNIEAKTIVVSIGGGIVETRGLEY